MWLSGKALDLNSNIGKTKTKTKQTTTNKMQAKMFKMIMIIHTYNLCVRMCVCVVGTRGIGMYCSVQVYVFRSSIDLPYSLETGSLPKSGDRLAGGKPQ